jgi:hypothetical protein
MSGHQNRVKHRAMEDEASFRRALATPRHAWQPMHYRGVGQRLLQVILTESLSGRSSICLEVHEAASSGPEQPAAMRVNRSNGTGVYDDSSSSELFVGFDELEVEPRILSELVATFAGLRLAVPSIEPARFAVADGDWYQVSYFSGMVEQSRYRWCVGYAPETWEALEAAAARFMNALRDVTGASPQCPPSAP